jgi:hypothetical protein
MTQKAPESHREMVVRRRVLRATTNGVPASTGLSEDARALLAEVLWGIRHEPDEELRSELDNSSGTPWERSLAALVDQSRFMAAVHELLESGVVFRRITPGLFLDFARLESLMNPLRYGSRQRRRRGIVSTTANRTHLPPVAQKKIA